MPRGSSSVITIVLPPLSNLLHIDDRVNIARGVERKSDEGAGISGIACIEEQRGGRPREGEDKE